MTESQSCCTKNRKAEDARDVRQKHGTVLTLVTGTGQEFNQWLLLLLLLLLYLYLFILCISVLAYIDLQNVTQNFYQ
jgi:hypothetical protein